MARNRRTVEDRVVDFRSVFEATLSGRRVLLDILKDCKVFETVPVGDPYILHFYEGMRHVGLSVLKQLNRSHDEILKLVEEADDGGQ